MDKTKESRYNIDIGLTFKVLVHQAAGYTPAILVLRSFMKHELSVFVDESGDFGRYNPKSPFYIIGIVFHDQQQDIANKISRLNQTLKNTELKRDFIHVGPLIRKEDEYINMPINDRLQILRRLIKFTSELNLKYRTFYIEKKHLADEQAMTARLARQLADFLKQNYLYFLHFDVIKIYYDHGQSGVSKTIISVFTALFENVEYKKSLQKDYKLLQVADLICTAKLVELKLKTNTLSRSERRILGTNRDIKKGLLKPLKRKEF